MEPYTASRLKEELRAAQQSEDLVVGDKPCTYNAVCDVVTSSQSVGTLWSNLVDVARGLDIPPGQVLKFTTKLINMTATHESLFYDILEVWRGSNGDDAKLSTLLCVLEKNGAKASADALLNHFGIRLYPCTKLEDIKKSTTWGNLSSGLKLQILEKEVFFQGKKTEFAEAIGHYDVSSIDGSILVGLATGKTPTLVNNQLPGELKYYVQRSIMSRKNLKKDVFQNACSDIILVQGINKLQLTELAEKKETDVSGNQFSQGRLTAQLILLQCDGDFERICKLTTQPVHWVKFKNDSYEWVKSSGSVENLQRYVHESQEGFNEVELLSKNDKVVVIADSPGMGKTMLLANIAHEILKRSPTTLVRFIVLKEFVEALSRKTIDREAIVSSIAAKASDLQFGRKLVEHALKTTKCILIFDGFDEVLLNQIEKAKKILQVIATSLNTAHIFVATRPHMQQELENTLHVLGCTVQPFEQADQMNFLLRFWQSKEVPTNSSTCQLADFILSSLTSNMSDFERDISGIPLQCRLLAESYTEDAKRCFEVGYQVYRQGSETSNIVSSIFDMYQKHMNNCFEKIRKDFSILSRLLAFVKLTMENQLTTIKHAHMGFALKLLFPEHSDQCQTIAESGVSILLNELCDLGILEATNSNDIRFVHRTFAEYLVAWFAMEHGKNAAIREFIITQVFGTKPDVEKWITPFFNYAKNTFTVETKSFHFNFPVICYFINGFVKKQRLQESLTSPSPSMPDLGLNQLIPQVFFASAYHNYLYGLMHASQLLSVGFKERANKELIHDSNERNIDGDLLLITAKYADIEMMKAFCEQININQIQFDDRELDYKITPLHVAIQRGHYFLVDYLVKQYKSELLSLQCLLHFCVHNSLDDSIEVINDKKLIIKLLTTKSKQWLDERFDGSEPLLEDKVNAELVECLIQEGADVNVLDEEENTVIHKITENPVTPEIFHRIIVGLSERGFKHFNTAEEEYLMTPLHCVVKSVEPLKETLELFASNGANFSAVDKKRRSVLFHAIFGGRSVNFIRLLIRFGADWNHVNKKSDNVLHVCADNAHYDALKYFIENHDLDINSLNNSFQTPLHLAVLNRSKRHKDIQETQRLLINLGANVCAVNGSGLLPIQQAFEKEEGLSLSIIKLMEQNGLSITNKIASETLQAALRNECIKPDEEFTKVLEYLIQKQNSPEYPVTWNPWKFEKIRQNMPDVIEHTKVTPELLAKLKYFALVTAAEMIKVEQTKTPVDKTILLYKILEGKLGSYERVCLTLILNNQIKPYDILRKNLLQAECSGTFTTFPPGVADLLSSKEMHVMILLTSHVELTIQRIQDNTNIRLNVTEEHDIPSHATKKNELTVVKCRNVTINLLKTLKEISLTGKILVLCSKSTEENQPGHIQSFKDDYCWEDFSMLFLRGFQCTIKRNHLHFHDLFTSAAVTKQLHTGIFSYNHKDWMKNDNKMLDFKIGHQIDDNEYIYIDSHDLFLSAAVTKHLEMHLDYKMRAFKIGHLITENEYIYLSSTIFHYFLTDKLVFVGITQDELKQYTNLGHKIGCKETTIENLDYIVCEQQHHFDEICEQTTCNVHLIEHRDGIFRLVKTFGFDSEIILFYEQPHLCENFPDCNCATGVDDLAVTFTFQEVWSFDNKIVKYSCKLNDVLPKMQRLLKLQDYVESFKLTRRYRNLVERYESPNFKTGAYNNAKALNQSVLRKIDYLFIMLEITESEYLKFNQIAVNSVFANSMTSEDLSELEKFANAGVLVYNNGTLGFLLESMAWYFIAKMVTEHEISEALITNILLNCSTSQNITVSYSSFENDVFGTKKAIVGYKSNESFAYLDATFFNFLEFFLSKQTLSRGNPKIHISKEVAEKWVHCCINENQYNLLKLIMSIGTCSNLLASRNIVLLAVQYASEPIIDLVVEQYTWINKKDIKDIKLQLTYGRKMSILHVAALRGNYAVVRYLLCKLDFKDVLNQPDMKDLLHCCVVDTICNHDDELEERKQILKLFLQHYPNLIEKRDNNNYTPLLVPNIHVDLVIHLINLGVDVHATNEESYNLLHLCPTYMISQQYQELVQYICAKGESKIFHSKNKYDETPLHAAVQHLELLESTVKLLASVNVDFNAKKKNGDTILILAVDYGRSAKFLDVLIRTGADVSMQGFRSRTVGQVAAKCGNLSALRYFLTQECDVNATNQYENIPLHLVLERTPPYTYEIVKILIEHGAKVNAIGRDKRTPLSIALERNKWNQIGSGTVELLKNAGALEFVTDNENTEESLVLSSSQSSYDEESSTGDKSESSSEETSD